MTNLVLTNTKTKMKEPVPTHQGVVKYYTCGPTVYAYAHIGNFRTFVAEDFLRRALQFFGYKVQQVMNLTDVDDKTIKGAIAQKTTLDSFTAIYKKAFFEDVSALNIQRAEHYPEATAFIPQMIQMIQTLLDKNMAYRGADGSIYYAITHFHDYGKLSHLKMDELQAGASERVGLDEYTKDHIADFVLWKKYDEERDGAVFWESPFGRGRPGWHIECSVMAEAILGETVDIHAGGVDLIFPHHENEIAQSEACHEKEFCRLWFHVEHLLVDHKKMSKSLGNFYTLRDLLNQGYTGREVRMMLLATHYRSQLNFTKDSLQGAKAAIARIGDFIDRLQHIAPAKESAYDPHPLITKTMSRFTEALADDLNISEALAALFECIREGNSLCDAGSIGYQGAQALLTMLREIDEVLAIMPFAQDEIPEEIVQLAEARKKAREEKEYERADFYRKQLLEKGYLVEDTAAGIRVKKV